MKTIDIQGKPYVTVNERIKEFRVQHPKFSLVSDLVEVNADHALIKASIIDETGRIIAQGTAFEKANSSFINKGSHVENCETSAWGRALGNLGIGIDASIASADEVANAVLNQRPTVKREDKPATGDIVRITDLCKETGTDMTKLYAFFKVQGSPTKKQVSEMIASLEKKLSSQLDSQA